MTLGFTIGLISKACYNKISTIVCYRNRIETTTLNLFHSYPQRQIKNRLCASANMRKADTDHVNRSVWSYLQTVKYLPQNMPNIASSSAITQFQKEFYLESIYGPNYELQLPLDAPPNPESADDVFELLQSDGDNIKDITFSQEPLTEMSMKIDNYTQFIKQQQHDLDESNRQLQDAMDASDKQKEVKSLLLSDKDKEQRILIGFVNYCETEMLRSHQCENAMDLYSDRKDKLMRCYESLKYWNDEIQSEKLQYAMKKVNVYMQWIENATEYKADKLKSKIIDLQTKIAMKTHKPKKQSFIRRIAKAIHYCAS
eukprot:1107300_1